MPTLARAFFVSLCVSLWGCPASTQTQCSGNGDCPSDAVCLESICQERQCSVSADCAMEHHCDPSSGQCLEGCLEDEDCYYGETCSRTQCEPKKCTSTTLDCAAGQFCDAATGLCYDAAGPYCAPCKTSDDCGGGYNYCGYVNGVGPFCFPECSSDKPCPAGYDCVAATSSGEIISYYCIALCGYLEGLETSLKVKGEYVIRRPSSSWSSP